jgi:mono/diheme cytochrome c family protein
MFWQRSWFGAALLACAVAHAQTPTPTPTPTPAASQSAGRALFAANCALCHQAEAQGAAGVAPPLKGAHWSRLAGVRHYVPGVLLVGMHGKLSLEADSFVGVMPAQNRLSDLEVASVTNYLLAGVNGQAGWIGVDASEVAAWRAAPPSVAQLRAARKQALTP